MMALAYASGSLGAHNHFSDLPRKLKSPARRKIPRPIGETAGVKNALSLLLLFCLSVAAIHAQDATPTPTATPEDSRSTDENRADMDVAGTLARVAPGKKMRVAVWAKNRGTKAWAPRDVRIIVRWIDFDTGTRRRWSYNWIKAVVPPDGQFRQSLDVPVPSRAGRYKVIYGLVRVPSNGSSPPPPRYDAPQNVWPDEFAAIAFAVNVGEAAPTL